jgi:hypothetical protein
VFKRKAGRPKGDRDDVPVKLARALVDKARVVAAHRQTTLAALLSSLLEEPMERAHALMVSEMIQNPDFRKTATFEELGTSLDLMKEFINAAYDHPDFMNSPMQESIYNDAGIKKDVQGKFILNMTKIYGEPQVIDRGNGPERVFVLHPKKEFKAGKPSGKKSGPTKPEGDGNS